ncbi:phage head closure protein [Desulfosporosinus meridiei]|uniref:Phage head-tail adaptor, putative, SPP1 family n=1 Tax=Desulfosporosinus meridiei (strain ATCC BAA-275 / DSM 13257 / KCTC 12902 / NCIMB 13706 / S10) TaxID=768704 RepID=J7J5Q1_DESMD|nr:phage head closure protein [Desulfosporosinus meridiei]AFQ46266.1 phage head-tail adaptor, putative, SPP1 family [Desulfosporosinus meridiei DSM 13257]
MNRPDQAIYLISTTISENDMGDFIEAKTKRLVFAEKKSIRQSEFYQAKATGLRPELSFVVWTREYAGEGKLEFDGKEYNIIRTFEPNSEDTELTCQGLVNGVV